MLYILDIHTVQQGVAGFNDYQIPGEAASLIDPANSPAVTAFCIRLGKADRISRYIGEMPVQILGCFWKKANAKAIGAAMLVGTLVSFCFDMFLKIPLGLNIDGCIIGAILCLIIAVGGSLLLNKKDA